LLRELRPLDHLAAEIGPRAIAAEMLLDPDLSPVLLNVLEGFLGASRNAPRAMAAAMPVGPELVRSRLGVQYLWSELAGLRASMNVLQHKVRPGGIETGSTA
jgi:hypothetical protein